MDDSTAGNGTRTGPLHWLIGLAAFVIIVQGIAAARSYIEPLLLAVLLALALAPAMAALRQRGVPIPVALLAVLLVLVGLGAALTLLVTHSVQDFSRQLPHYGALLDARVADVVGQINTRLPALDIDALRAQFDPGIAMNFAGALLGGLGRLVGSGMLVLLIVIFVLLEAGTLRSKLERASRNPATVLHFDHIVASINRYLVIKGLLSAVNGIAIATWFWLIGIDYAPMWGLLMFMFNFVPGVGQPLALLPPLLLAWLQLPPESLLLAAAGGFVINGIVGNWLEPKYLGQGLGLSTLVVILSLIVWGWALGPVGMLLSVPLTMVLKIIFEGMPETHGIAVLLGPGENFVPASGSRLPRTSAHPATAPVRREANDASAAPPRRRRRRRKPSAPKPPHTP